MPAHPATRSSHRILSAAAMAACVGMFGLVPSAHAQLGKKKDHKTTTTQPRTNQPQTPATTTAAHSFLDDIFSNRGRTHDWILKVNIHVDSYQDRNIYVQPGVVPTTPQSTSPNSLGPSGSMPQNVPFKFDSASVIFPAIKSTAGSTLDSEITGTIKIDGKVYSSAPTSYLDNLPCGGRYAKWEMTNVEGRQLDFDVELPVTCHELMFDEAKAAKATWPKDDKWPRVAASTFAPQMGVDTTAPILGETIKAWCSGKSPQSIPPLKLAKYIASKVLEEIQPSGDGLVSSRTGILQGFDLHGVDYTLREKRGSEHDIACTLCALYRVAGLPARLVIGWDVSESKGHDLGLKRKGTGELRSWVEFAIVDESVKTDTGEARLAWIPVDVVRQRKSGSKAPPLDRPWKYFGNNDDTDSIIPIAFHYHPPTTVVAHGSPCFWGWITFPEMQYGAEQMVRFVTITAPKTAPAPSDGGSK
jgi:hypothetical protein